MIHIFITHKQSERFPNKNETLLPHTVAWLEKAIPLLKEACQVYCAGALIEGLPASWTYLPLNTNKEHRLVVSEAEQMASPQQGDVCVLTQLTQPLRDTTLLHRAVSLCRESGKTVISATQMPDPTWRRIDAHGSWSSSKKHHRFLFHDGRLYAWQPGRSHEIFDCNTPHAVVRSEIPFIIDVDTPDDWTSELRSLLK